MTASLAEQQRSEVLGSLLEVVLGGSQVSYPRRLAQAQRKRARPRTFAIGAECHGAMKAGVFGAEFAQ